jgi:hypothetical protein
MNFVRAPYRDLLLCLFFGACAPALPTNLPPTLKSPYTGYSSPKYKDDAMWLCRPDLAKDGCRADLTATEIRPDGSRVVVPHKPAVNPQIDCFYVYPTVDLGWIPRNHTDFTDRQPMTHTALAQAARFGEVCAVYAPLYRQVTIGTYFLSEERRERFLQTAYSDVLDAFLHYMSQYNHGRKVALIGHSQGADMVSRLLRQVFEHDPTMRERLLVAMPIGGQVEVARGKLSGGTFDSIPLCTRPEEPGCVVAFRTHREGSELSSALVAKKPEDVVACTNPANLTADTRARLSRTYYPLGERLKKYIHGVQDVTTPYVLYRDYYEASCVEGAAGYQYLAVAPAPLPDDKRQNPVDLNMAALNGRLGTHILDMQFTQGDLIDLIARKAQALTNQP